MRTIRLCQGVGEEGVSHCVMAATSIVAGEKFSDAPQCVCPTITSALIALNDSYGADDEAREAALGHLPWLIIGTRGPENVMVQRALAFADIACRDVLGMDIAPIVDADTAEAAAAAVSWPAWMAASAAEAATSAAKAEKAAEKAAKKLAALGYAVRAADRAAQAAYAAAYADRASSAVEDPRLLLVRAIEERIIPIHTTMTVEPGCNSDRLIANSARRSLVDLSREPREAEPECLVWPVSW